MPWREMLSIFDFFTGADQGVTEKGMIVPVNNLQIQLSGFAAGLNYFWSIPVRK